MDAIFNFDSSILLWIQDNVRADFASPIVKSAKIRLWNGNTLKITVHGQSDENIYVSKACFNGRSLDDFTIPATELMRGGVLEFNMSEDR